MMFCLNMKREHLVDKLKTFAIHSHDRHEIMGKQRTPTNKV